MVDAAPPPHGAITGIAGGILDTVRTLPPVLLLIVLLNFAFCGVGGWYLLKVEEYRADDRKAMTDMLTRCLTEEVPVSYLQMMLEQRK